ncbi:MAG TPA: glycosyltransferase, partial [Anaerolineales bacterium]|nr:glycosyltransferase [Anaerolineales bacterium]
KVLPTLKMDYEVILVNDGSADGSWRKICLLSEEFDWVVGVNMMRNYGQHNATLCGIREAKYDVIVTMDDDLQNPPAEIPKLLDGLKNGADVVYGVARRRGQVWWKSASSAIVKRAIAFVMGARNVQDIGAFRAFRTELRHSFESFTGSDVLIDVLLSWGTTKFTSVEVDETTRKIGESHYGFFKLIKVTLLVLTSFTTIPLRLASILGLLFTLIGFLVFIYILVIYFTVGSIPGFPFLVSVITIFSGAQLFSLGIIGEYLARVFERTGGKPAYTISERVN